MLKRLVRGQFHTAILTAWFTGCVTVFGFSFGSTVGFFVGFSVLAAGQSYTLSQGLITLRQNWQSGRKSRTAASLVRNG